MHELLRPIPLSSVDVAGILQILTLIAGTSSVLGGALAEAASSISRKRAGKVDGVAKALEEKTADIESPSIVARRHVKTRIKEAIDYRADQLRAAKWSNGSSNLLIIGQYIIGGVLASSFIQEWLTPKWVGALGVVVLIASLFRQQYLPELKVEPSKRNGAKAQGLIRLSEDQLAILDAKIAGGQDHTDAMIALITHITEKLSEIENPEALAGTA